MCKSRLPTDGVQNPWSPTRLIDLSDPNGVAVLLETKDEAPVGPYITLSHCWGEVEVPKTTRAILEEFKARLPKLSKTFDDALFVARRLSIKYIWIDSLCIVQDDLEDWTAESSRMDQVYQNAFCNLAATASAHSEGGLFFSRPDLRPCQVLISQGSGPQYFWLVEESLFWTQVEHAALLKVRRRLIEMLPSSIN